MNKYEPSTGGNMARIATRAALSVFCVVMTAAPVCNAAYQGPDRSKLRIGAYFLRTKGGVTEGHVRDLKECGIDFVFDRFNAKASRAEYDLYAKYGIGAVVTWAFGNHDFDFAMEDAVEAVLGTFYRAEHGLVFENMPASGEPDLSSSLGRQLNPGHVLEAMWFLLAYLETRPGSHEKIAKIADIIGNTLEFGWDKEYGGIYYFMDALGKPHLELQHNMKLWWVHCEAILAALYAYDLTREARFLDWFEKLDAWTWQHYPDPEYGEWFAYLDRRGEVTSSLKGGKWKTCFHVPRALLFAARRMRKIAASLPEAEN